MDRMPVPETNVFAPCLVRGGIQENLANDISNLMHDIQDQVPIFSQVSRKINERIGK